MVRGVPRWLDMRIPPRKRDFGWLLALALCTCSGGDPGDGRVSDPSAAGTMANAGSGATTLMDGAVAGQTSDAATPAADSGSTDAAVSAAPDASVPRGFVPDPVTLGQSLPARLPVLRVDVGGATIEKDVEVPGTLEIFEQHDGTHTDLDTKTPTLRTKVAFQGRGNFTWHSLDKKGYAFELQDDLGNGKDHAILGMPEGSDFALYGCYTDKTCLRSALVYALGQELGRYSVRARFVELFIDGDYEGLYMLLERIRRDALRVDVPKPAADPKAGDVSGGYIFRMEGPGKGAPRDFTVEGGRIYTYHYPKAEDLAPVQKEYLTKYVQSFETAMNATAEDHAAWIDLPSWVDHGIVEEVTHNWDGYVHSVYFVKNAEADGGKLAIGPLWDFDLAFGNGNVTGYNCNTSLWAYEITRAFPDEVPGYWRALYENEEFKTAWKCRYLALRKGPLALATFEARIATWRAFTADARKRDQARWPTLGKLFSPPNCDAKPTYAEEVAALHDFIAARLTWLDTRAAAMPGSCPSP